MWLALAPIACTTILNIDGHYVAVSSAGGRPVDSGSPTLESGVVASGGSTIDGSGGVIVVGVGGANTGGGPVQASGGSTSGGGTNAAGGAGTGGGIVVVTDCSQSMCTAGLKCCGNPTTNQKACYSPSPLVGCGETGCDHCTNTVPTNATAACDGSQCTFGCNPGYVNKNGTCVVQATGGAGSMDAGGPTGAGGKPCVPTQCQTCGPAGFGCCLQSGACGCTYFDISIGGRLNIGYCLPRPTDIIFPPRP